MTVPVPESLVRAGINGRYCDFSCHRLSAVSPPTFASPPNVKQGNSMTDSRSISLSENVSVSERLAEIAERIAETVTAPAAYDVDLRRTFPIESLAALKEDRVLSAIVPVEQGGMGATLSGHQLRHSRAQPCLRGYGVGARRCTWSSCSCC